MIEVASKGSMPDRGLEAGGLAKEYASRTRATGIPVVSECQEFVPRIKEHGNGGWNNKDGPEEYE